MYTRRYINDSRVQYWASHVTLGSQLVSSLVGSVVGSGQWARLSTDTCGLTRTSTADGQAKQLRETVFFPERAERVDVGSHRPAGRCARALPDGGFPLAGEGGHDEKWSGVEVEDEEEKEDSDSDSERLEAWGVILGARLTVDAHRSCHIRASAPIRRRCPLCSVA